MLKKNTCGWSETISNCLMSWPLSLERYLIRPLRILCMPEHFRLFMFVASLYVWFFLLLFFVELCNLIVKLIYFYKINLKKNWMNFIFNFKCELKLQSWTFFVYIYIDALVLFSLKWSYYYNMKNMQTKIMQNWL